MKIKLFFILILVFTISCKKDSKTIQKLDAITEVTISENGKHCFESLLENKIPKGDGFVLESDVLSVSLLINNSDVTGTYSFIPYKGNPSKGDFKGTIANNIITAIYAFNKNNEAQKEEIVFKIEKNKISLLGGEKVTKDGVSVFKNKKDGVYMIEIPRVDCNK